jgi:xylulokinase
MDDATVLGIDCSTTAVKAIAWDLEGHRKAAGRAPIALDNPAPDAWEQDAEEWWSATTTAVRAAVASLGNDAGRLRALAVTHQRETFVLTDDSSRPLRPALSWMDARCRPQVKTAIERLGEARLHEISGKPACVTPSLYKHLFLMELEPQLGSTAFRFCDVHAFLVWRLTGRFATSLASADPLGLVDLKKRDWSDELVGLAGLERSQLPELVEPGAPLGTLSAGAAGACGLPAGLPVIAGAGDGQAAGLGAGISAPGRAYLNLGTAIVSGVLSRDVRIDRAFRTMIGAAPASFFLETDLKGGTFTLTWLVEKLLGRDARDTNAVLAELEASAVGIPPGSDGLMLVPYWNGVMNPYWDDEAAGITIGWHGGHGPAHVYRAVLEGIAFEQRLHLEGVERASRQRIEELVAMGGGSRSALWCQLIADVMNKRVVRAGESEATALGAGMLAAAGAGLHADVPAAARSMSSTAETFQPGSAADRYDELYREVYMGIYPGIRESLQKLTRLGR